MNAGSRVALSLLLLLAAVGCGGGTSSDGRPPNLLLITVDTTRADVLGCYGGSVETPVMDRLAAEGVRFDNAWTVTPLTLPSHASILTGLQPPSHGIRENTNFRLPEGVRTLAEHLGENGYSTGAAVSSIVLSKIFGLDQGFDTYDEPHAGAPIRPGGASVEFREILERKAGETTDQVLAGLLPQSGKPFFQWVHYYDPHSSYDPPEPFASRYRDDLYAGEVAYVDSEIGRLLSGLESRGMLENTLIAVLSDHGESLGEHGENTHGLFIYRSTIQVPLILHMPGILDAGTVRDDPVSVVDLVPTLLEIMKVPPMSLPVEQPLVYAEGELSLRAYGWAPLYSLHDGATRFIAAPRPELYDMAADREELNNLAGSRPEEVREWQRRLAAMVDLLPPPPMSEGPGLDSEERRRLMSLGYLSGGDGVEGTAGSSADPKDRVAIHNQLIRAGALLATGNPEQAGVVADEVLAVDPDNPGALALAGVLAVSGALEGLADLRRAAELAPGNWEIRRNLANALHISGDPGGAAREYQAAAELQPADPSTWFGLGNALFSAGDLVHAEEAYRQALALDREQPAVRAALGTTLGKRGDLDGGREMLRAALDQEPAMADAWNQLGILEEKGGDLPAARSAYLRTLELAPDHADALFNTAKVSLRLGEVQAAREWLGRLKQAHPGYPLTPVLEERLGAP
ncbi:MAG: sulfatase-like hydrolase/transferase [Acidobacteria bacterium]|uniref:Sulfatase-like hydrolase/transferase n=1 Tax=Candidatus Polarisedimenticola svalbardensis TaxID=2886004 RepID=A0A8J6Y7A9_9BACT|nr:sulfatase-like hydrolase/transferase [Candidatus Polarisedimenticola svalbardensis]